MKIIPINPAKDLIFNIKAQEACKACKRYGLTGCCPPHIGSFDYYKELIPSYEYGNIYIRSFSIPEEELNQYKIWGKKSSKELHQILLDERNRLLNEGHHFNLMLGGGSCKFCDKCYIPCKNPQYRAIPIEATGIDVVSTLKKFGIDIQFPVKNSFYRIGLILWD